MKLEKDFRRQIQKAVGSGDREAKFELLGAVRKAARDMSTPKIPYEFNEAVRKHGRAIVALSVAATITERSKYIKREYVEWAGQVMQMWTTKPNVLYDVCIKDDLHPSRIEEYARLLITSTTE